MNPIKDDIKLYLLARNWKKTDIANSVIYIAVLKIRKR